MADDVVARSVITGRLGCLVSYARRRQERCAEVGVARVGDPDGGGTCLERAVSPSPRSWRPVGASTGASRIDAWIVSGRRHVRIHPSPHAARVSVDDTRLSCPGGPRPAREAILVGRHSRNSTAIRTAAIRTIAIAIAFA